MKQVRVTSLGSGSKGNATVIEYQHSRVLIDSGFSCKELEQRLLARDIDPDSFSAVLVTHEHSDHFNGVPAFANKYKLSVWMNKGTSLNSKSAKIKKLQIFNSHVPFSVDELVIQPVLVPHDSREASQFVVHAANVQVGVLTDLGHITPFIVEQYARCNILLLEFNHDLNTLLSGKYPASLKARVSGSLGHLNNQQAAEFLAETEFTQLNHVVAMHLSEENNNRSLVERLLSNTLEGRSTTYQLAKQDSGFDWVCLPVE